MTAPLEPVKIDCEDGMEIRVGRDPEKGKVHLIVARHVQTTVGMVRSIQTVTMLVAQAEILAKVLRGEIKT